MTLDVFKRALMQEVVEAHLNSIPAAKSGDTRSFIEAAANWFSNWWSMKPNWGKISPGYCAIVLNHKFDEGGLPGGFAEKMYFRDAPASNIGGRIYVSDYSLTRVFSDAGEHMDVDSIFRQLKATKLETAPCVIFAPETGILLIAENGISTNVAHTKLARFDGNLTVANVDHLLTSFYDTSLKFPETFPQIWWKKEACVPMFQAEKLYQNLLFIYLKANTQNTWVIVREDQSNAGRTDLTLNALNPQIVFVVEMKVLKSFFFDRRGRPARKFNRQQNIDWAYSGVDQVRDYQTAKAAREAFLLLYDMREKHDVLKRVATRCKKEKVLLRKYDIFNATARDTRALSPKQPKTR